MPETSALDGAPSTDSIRGKFFGYWYVCSIT
jgi:hypothetical protein